MKKAKKPNLDNIKILVLDVDGVLTDGTLIINPDGSESKQFNTLDGHGMRMWQRAGFKIALLSGRFSEPTSRRAKQLDIEFVFQDAHVKTEQFDLLLEQSGLKANNVAYVGDDLPDVPVMRLAGFAVAVAGATDEVKEAADMVTTRPGGKGAVREVIEYILKSKGQWQGLLSRYL